MLPALVLSLLVRSLMRSPIHSSMPDAHTFSRQQTLYRGGELDIPGEELGDAVLDLVLSNKLRSAEVEALDLLGALRKVGPVQHGGLLGHTGAQL